MSETQPGVDDVTPLSDQTDPATGDADEPDQDAEPSLNAPEEGRPDGIDTDDDAAPGGDGSPS